MSFPGVYSTRLLTQPGTSSAGDTESATVPAGYVWVVRDIAAFNTQTGPMLLSGFYVYFKVAGAGLPVTFAGVLSPWAQASRPYTWNGRVVLNAGDVLTLYAFDKEWSIAVSGYQLSS